MSKATLVKNICTGLILQYIILAQHRIVVITATKDNETTAFSARNLGRLLMQCISSNEKLKCLELQCVNTLDAVLQDNSTWQYSDYLVIEKKSSNDQERNYMKFLNISQTDERQRQQRSFTDTIGEKLLQLFQMRSIRLQLPKPPATLLQLSSGISDALDDLTGSAGANEGRKKMKDKNMAMMGGMAMLAMVAQLFLGKVILIAGSAFIMAKVALAISVLGSLKKGSSGSTGSTDHVIVTNAGGSGSGHSHDSGWHRSMPYDYTNTHILSDKQDTVNIPTHNGAAGSPVPQPNFAKGVGVDATRKPIYYYDDPMPSVGADVNRRHTAMFL